jgi:hypothetical protein
MIQTAGKKRSLTVSLHEKRSLGGRVDHGRGIIFGVKVCGRSSPNTHGVRGVDGTDYTLEALRKAAPLYEGINCNVDHPPRKNPDQERSAHDRFAWLENIEARPSGLYGDLHFLDPQDPLAVKMMNAAESKPDAYALSHNANGKGEVRNRRFVIYEIPEVRSVDIVADGGTNRSLFEGRQMKVRVSEVLKNKVMMALDAGRKKRLDKLLAGALTESRSPLMEASDSNDHRDHMYNAMRACEEAGNEEGARGIHKLLDPSKRVEEAGEDENAEDKYEEEEEDAGEEDERAEMEGQGEEGPGEPGEHNEGTDGKGGPGAAMEEGRGRRGRRRLPGGVVVITEAEAIDMCQLAGMEATASLVETLTGVPHNRALKTIREVKRQREIGRKSSPPRSTAPLREGRESTAPIPKDLKTWAETLRG